MEKDYGTRYVAGNFAYCLNRDTGIPTGFVFSLHSSPDFREAHQDVADEVSEKYRSGRRHSLNS